MVEISDSELVFLRNLVERGGEGTVNGNSVHTHWDGLVQQGFVTRSTISQDAVRYVVTEAGRSALWDADLS